MQVTKTVQPITATAASMVELFGIPEKTIRRLAAEGAIRSAKLAVGKSGRRIYFVADMVELLETGRYSDYLPQQKGTEE